MAHRALAEADEIKRPAVTPCSEMKKIQFLGTNFNEIKDLLGDKVLAPYFCMGLSMLSVLTADGFVTVNEGDWIVIDEAGGVSVE